MAFDISVKSGVATDTLFGDGAFPQTSLGTTSRELFGSAGSLFDINSSTVIGNDYGASFDLSCFEGSIGVGGPVEGVLDDLGLDKSLGAKTQDLCQFGPCSQ